jgi:hypothetical protein
VGKDETAADVQILHEFGHALGFVHGWHAPLGKCDNEINWNTIFNYFSGPPYFWSFEQTRDSMRRIPSDLLAGQFDRRSVMNYQLPGSMSLS